MFRYIAVVWNELWNDKNRDADDAARLSATLDARAGEWRSAMSRPGLEIWYAGAGPGSGDAHLLDDAAGVVLGRLFKRHSTGESHAAPLQFGPSESEAVRRTAGRHLIEHYWGRYVAFLHDSTKRVTRVLRDPTGTLPCLQLKLGGASVYFSDVEDLWRLGFGSFSINWTYIAAALCYTRLQAPATGLAEVSQVLGGECIEIGQDCTGRTFYWDPLRVARSNIVEDPVQAVSLVARVTRECVHAWASGHESILHTLSGGLDSSIVLACLADAPSAPRITCVNNYSPGSNTDERAFARLAADRVCCELIERQRNSALSLEGLLEMRLSAIPTSYLYYLETTRADAQLAQDKGATALFSGNTGDQLFYQSRASFAAGDFVHRKGWRRGLFRVALDAARVDRLSVWRVLRDAVTHQLLGKRWSPHEEPGRYKTLIRRDALERVTRQVSRAPDLQHPVFRDAARLPSGKLWHAWQLVFPPDYYNPFARAGDPEPVAPLYSQPLIELLLRIPTDVLIIGGWDRAVARRAFKLDVPREIITRRTKGGQEEHARAILVRNRDFVRGLLLEGLLVREGILDRGKLEAALSDSPTRVGSGNAEIYECLGVESWLRRWGTRGRTETI